MEDDSPSVVPVGLGPHWAVEPKGKEDYSSLLDRLRQKLNKYLSHLFKNTAFFHHVNLRVP